MIVAYVTAAESDVHLAAHADWLALTDAEKDGFLSWGRIWIDSTYDCLYDETNATENMKHANSLAGYMQFKRTLYADNPSVDSTSVTAGSVSSSKTYSSGHTEEDQFMKQARLLLDYDCESTRRTGSIGLDRN